MPIKELNDGEFKDEDSLWEEGEFIKSISQEELKEKRKSIGMEHNEDVNYNCKKCNKKISLHNRDWHNEMCDECFNETYYPKLKKEKKNSK